MAVTPVGNPYVESSDLVANYPGASEALAERIDIVGVNPFANAAARDAAIPSPVQGQMCSLNDDNKGYRYDGSAWILFSGAGPANFTNTATGTFSSGGIDYKYITWTGSGDLIVDRAGFADILVIGGGAGGANGRGGAGGAGGHLFITNAYLPAGTLTVTVGAGGAAGVSSLTAGNNGIASSVNSYFSPGGGAGMTQGGGGSLDARPGINGASGGGAGGSQGGSLSLNQGGSGISSLGFAGGNSANTAGGGGGGSSAVGANASTSNGGGGGAGTANSITNTSVTRAGGGGGFGGSTSGAGGSGGGGNTGVSGSINTGSGGGGANTAGGAGGSGVVIVRVVV